MDTKINYKVLIPYFICTTTYLFAAIVNMQLVEQFLVFKEVSSGLLDKIYYYDILGYVIAGVILFIFGSYFDSQRIIIFNLLIYLISVYNIGFSEPSETFQKIYPMIYSGTNLMVTTVWFFYIFDNKKINSVYFFGFFISNIFVAYFLVQLVLSYQFFETNSIDQALIRGLVIVNIIPITIFLVTFIGSSCFHPLNNKTVNSLIILKNADLELLSSFTVFYVIMAIFYDYEIYEFTDSLLSISVSKIKYYILSIMAFVSIFASKFILKYNMHKINISCLAISLFTFLSMPFWSFNIVLSTMCWFVIAMALYLYFCSNLLILAAKFTHSYLRLAIMIYMLIGAIGYFSSYVIAKNMEEDDNEYNFLISICLIMANLLAYYLYRYKKNNLRKW